jgi:hypothetical protein
MHYKKNIERMSRESLNSRNILFLDEQSPNHTRICRLRPAGRRGAPGYHSSVRCFSHRHSTDGVRCCHVSGSRACQSSTVRAGTRERLVKGCTARVSVRSETIDVPAARRSEGRRGTLHACVPLGWPAGSARPHGALSPLTHSGDLTTRAWIHVHSDDMLSSILVPTHPTY